MTRTPFAMRAHHAPPTAAECLQAWRQLFSLVRAHAATEAGGATIDKDAQILFAGRVVRLGKMPFPIRHASAQQASAAFHQLVRGYMTAARPDFRAALAAAAIATAECCETMIAEDVAERGDLGRQSLPPGDR